MAREYQLVRGLVEPADWDDNWATGGVVVVGDDEEYRVDPSGKGQHLLELLHEWVEVGGVVDDDNGELMLSVKKVRVLEKGVEYDDDDEDDGWDDD